MAQRTLTSLAENEMAVVPPTSWKVLVVAETVVVVVGGFVVAGVVDVVDRTVVEVVGRTVVEVVVDDDPMVVEVVGSGEAVTLVLEVVDGCVVCPVPGANVLLRGGIDVVDSSTLGSPVGAVPLDRSPVDPGLSTVRSVAGADVREESARALAGDPGWSVVADPSAAASLVSADGAMPSSTVETPVQATATAAVLPRPHNTT